MLADDMMKAGRAKYVLIVCAEEPSKYCNWQERDTSILFGDGAGAVVLGPGKAFKDVRLTMISDRDVLYYERGMEKTPFEKKPVEGQPLMMKGKDLFRTAVSESAKDIQRVLKDEDVKPSDVDFYLLHQANKRLGREDLLEMEMATHSGIIAWRIPWMEQPCGYSPWGHKESDVTG